MRIRTAPTITSSLRTETGAAFTVTGTRRIAGTTALPAAGALPSRRNL